MNSSVRIGTKVIVTPEMIEAWRDSVPMSHLADDHIAHAYRAMRALEPGLADAGVYQEPGVNPYGARR